MNCCIWNVVVLYSEMSSVMIHTTRAREQCNCQEDLETEGRESIGAIVI